MLDCGFPEALSNNWEPIAADIANAVKLGEQCAVFDWCRDDKG